MNLSREFDVTAWIALTLSLGGALWQLYLWDKGADVRLIAPEHFALYGQSDAAGNPMVRIAAPVSVLNEAEPPYGSAVVDEWAVLQIGDFKALQQWNGLGAISRERGHNKVSFTGPAMPEALPAASGTSSVVLFVTGQKGKRCGEAGPCDRGTAELRPAELLARASVGSTMTLSIIFEDVNGHRREASCSRRIDLEARSELEQLPYTPAYIWCVRST